MKPEKSKEAPPTPISVNGTATRFTVDGAKIAFTVLLPFNSANVAAVGELLSRGTVEVVARQLAFGDLHPEIEA